MHNLLQYQCVPIPLCSELAGVIKEKKAQLPPADAEGNRPKSALDGEIAALEAVRCMLRLE